MDDLTYIYMHKVFLRLKNKTQLISAQADDHYHTRLAHSLEVASIADSIANKLTSKFCIDKTAVLEGALLHDIGHTPFGHAGERALHAILSGKDDCFGILKEIDIVGNGIQQGFKHNINSGLIYTEMIPYVKRSVKVMDAVVKHTKICYEKNIKHNKLDYGFESIRNEWEELKEDGYYSNNPKYPEGNIVAISDEIAQVCSDYLDLAHLDKGFIDKVKKTKLYSISEHDDYLRKQSMKFCEKLIDLAVEDINNIGTISPLASLKKFNRVLRNFNNVKKGFMENSLVIKLFDNSRATVIKTLFGYYYCNPNSLESPILESIQKALRKHNGLPSKIYGDIDNVVELIQKAKETISATNPPPLTNAQKKGYKEVVKVFLRYIAVYISKMTDNYANKKYSKIINGSIAKQ